jgi:hypothetical protein
MFRHLTVLCALGLGCLFAQGEQQSANDIGRVPDFGDVSKASSKTIELSSAQPEIELALKAAPVHLRNDATVYSFGKSGYEKARTGTNGFNCLVNRDGTQNGEQSVYPTCWDPEGSRTILPVMLRVGELIAQGKSAAEIKRDIDEGFKQGRFHSPAKTGIAYMLAGDVKFDPKTGQFGSQQFPSHYMIYAPGVSNADIGVTNDALKKTPGLPFVYSGYSGGTRTAYIIVMADQATGHTMQGQNPN